MSQQPQNRGHNTQPQRIEIPITHHILLIIKLCYPPHIASYGTTQLALVLEPQFSMKPTPQRPHSTLVRLIGFGLPALLLASLPPPAPAPTPLHLHGHVRDASGRAAPDAAIRIDGP